MKTKEPEAPRTMRQVRGERIANIAEWAKEAFAEHRVEALWFGLPYTTGRPFEANAWLCSKPDRCEYAFTLYSVPGRLIVCGNIGTLVVQHERDMLRWARSAIESIDYFAEKIVTEIETEEYDPDMVRAYVHETDQDVLNDERSDAFVKTWIGETRAELLSAIGDGEHRVMEVVCGSPLYNSDVPVFKNFKHVFLWQREAIKWFLAQGVV